MHITKLRLLGFKSFVEPTELVIEQGLTGVVGPNGCGKSNLLEALRWAMGETSYKSMRASSMDDVIFSGTTQRPARNMAEVTMFIDNSRRTAPAEFNDHDLLEVTRRIEREMGSAYRVNGRETRARDVKILFEDAATGARSPALVRQGQIAEIVNAKPEQRRRILEDAAGVAGLHSRRHEAELRLKAAEANLARVGDVLGQLNAQMETLKRQARQARRYKELSEEIRRAEALLHHVVWMAAEAEVTAEEAALAGALEKVAAATAREAELVTLEHDAVEKLPSLREAEARAAAALHRLKVEQENFEREAERSQSRQTELAERTAQQKRDLHREEALAKEARDSLARLGAEKSEIERTETLAVDFEDKAKAALAAAEMAVKSIEQRLSGLQTAAAEARAKRRSLEAQCAERKEAVARIERQLQALETQAREIAARAPDAHRLKSLGETGQALAAELTNLEAETQAADDALRLATAAAGAKREAAKEAELKARSLTTEVETLLKLLKPAADDDLTLVVDQLKVTPGYELALGAALGEDLEAPVDISSPVHWRLNLSDEPDPPLPHGVEPLAKFVKAPRELSRRLAQIGVVDRAAGAHVQPKLSPGQRLVTREGDLWRWDGFVAAAHGTTAAAQRLAERNRLGALQEVQATAVTEAATAAAEAAVDLERHAAADREDRRLRQLWRETQARLAETREALTTMERQARETEARLATVTEAKEAAGDALVDANERLTEVEMALETLGDLDPFEQQLTAAQEAAIEKRAAVAEARADLATLEREHRMRTERLTAIGADLERWTTRAAGAEEQTSVLQERIAASEEELLAMADLPAEIEAQRGRLLDALTQAEAKRRSEADALAAAETTFRETQQQLRAAQGSVSTEREAKARSEARLEAARQRRIDHARKTQEALGVLPDACLTLAGHDVQLPLPTLDDSERVLLKLKADRERLGGVNLAADDDLAALTTEHDALDKERADVEAAIAKLRGGIAELNKEAKGRLATAFDQVNGHFQHLFGVLFGGGEARLEMIQSEEDPLQGGLEIIAKPPGKKPATLSLLSGGEQTLTALSLIFAVFLTNPSPICVLDEVDAPLDDANVDRFCTMMERMAADTATRFLVITHHPMTMTRMNRLFGVTMAEKGVSQLVSVDLEAARRFVESDAA
jgi:chromosome segregation protein